MGDLLSYSLHYTVRPSTLASPPFPPTLRDENTSRLSDCAALQTACGLFALKHGLWEGEGEGGRDADTIHTSLILHKARRVKKYM